MKIVLLSAASSIHTLRWANGLCEQGHEVHVISQHPLTDNLDPKVNVHLFKFRGIIGYFTMVKGVKKLLQNIKPDIVNAHYASGYGTTARLVGYHPWVLSVWGSDVYDFPHKSRLHKWLVTKNLRAADHIASTSHCMAEETRTLLPELTDIAITPFGVDLESYSQISSLSTKPQSKLVIGTVKTMKHKYGIDTLIQAYALLLKSLKTNPNFDEINVELRLVGGGEQTSELETLAETLEVASNVNFVGQVPHTQVPSELEKFDIYVALSRLDSESFGVAIVEASAAGRPVVVSDVGGLPEVTLDGITGIVVAKEDPQAATLALEQLVLNSDLRFNMGAAGKKHVSETYSWPVCISTMLDVYTKTISKYKVK